MRAQFARSFRALSGRYRSSNNQAVVHQAITAAVKPVHPKMEVLEERRDPLLAFCEDHARLYSRSLAHAREHRRAVFPVRLADPVDEPQLRSVRPER